MAYQTDLDPLTLECSDLSNSKMSSVEKYEFLEDSTNCKHSSSVNDFVRAVQKVLNQKCSDTNPNVKQSNSIKRKRRRKRKMNVRKHQRFSNETDEQKQFRLLRNRMLSMKTRLIKRLEMPEVYKEQQDTATQKRRLKKKRILAQETPEQTEERKRRNREQIRESRQRIREIETPEQKIERNVKKSLQRKALKLLETPEQREARLKRKRIYLKQKKERLENETQVKGKVSAKTGRIYVRESRKNNNSAEENTEKNADNEFKQNLSRR